MQSPPAVINGRQTTRMIETYTVPPDTHRTRADKLLAAAMPEHSRAAWQRALAAGLVKVKGRAAGRSDSLAAGDEVSFEFPAVVASELRPADIALEVIYEDKHLLAVNKPAGMVVHPGAGTREDTLVHALLAHCGDSLSGIGGVQRPGIVHRLDRETSGLIVVAKTDAAHRGLAAQFAGRTLHKEYLALVDGVPQLLGGSIKKPIGRNPRQRHKMAIAEEGQRGRDAHTDWQLVEKFGRIAALVRCTIHTGRTHQIRVHLKSLGHILLGDAVYGWKPAAKLPVQPKRVMLHAEHLVFTHPVTGKKLDLHAPLPKDFAAQLAGLRKLERAAQKAATVAATAAKKRKTELATYHVHEPRK
ncbi:MAG: RluA family pseudouridine synthase [Verrucomicrobiota bacterium]